MYVVRGPSSRGGRESPASFYEMEIRRIPRTEPLFPNIWPSHGDPYHMAMGAVLLEYPDRSLRPPRAADQTIGRATVYLRDDRTGEEFTVALTNEHTGWCAKVTRTTPSPER
jgi:hypothetical protein